MPLISGSDSKQSRKSCLAWFDAGGGSFGEDIPISQYSATRYWILESILSSFSCPAKQVSPHRGPHLTHKNGRTTLSGPLGKSPNKFAAAFRIVKWHRRGPGG